MTVHSPRNSQFDFDNASTPPPPPPKAPPYGSPYGTPVGGPPRPPPPPGQISGGTGGDGSLNQGGDGYGVQNAIAQVEEGWLPKGVREMNTADLTYLLQTPSLQTALLHSPETTHPFLPPSTAALHTLLGQNLQLAASLQQLESQIHHQRRATQSRLLALRALEAQWRQKQSEQDEALRDFSPPALYQRLAAAVAEQDSLCKGLEASFLEEQGGVASEREVGEFVKRLKEARRVGYLRRERKERWDEGRVGGWR